MQKELLKIGWVYAPAIFPFKGCMLHFVKPLCLKAKLLSNTVFTFVTV